MRIRDIIQYTYIILEEGDGGRVNLWRSTLMNAEIKTHRLYPLESNLDFGIVSR